MKGIESAQKKNFMNPQREIMVKKDAKIFYIHIYSNFNSPKKEQKIFNTKCGLYSFSILQFY